MTDIRGYLTTGSVTDLKATSRDGAIMELVALASESPAVGDPEKLLEAVFEREGIMSTGIGLGIAVPHAKIGSVTDFVVTIGRSRTGLDFNALDGKPVQIVVLIAGPNQEQQRYLEILAGMTMRLKSTKVREGVLAAGTPEEIVEILATARA